ncbi:MAG: hypothetical protein AB1746_06150, partial [Candidatus Zixiibacteriota bacterium]
MTTRPANTYHVVGVTVPMDYNRNEDEPLLENSEWLLTAILSHDYQDGGGDPLNPLDCAYPSVDNGGYWVAFKYTGFNGSNYNDYSSVDTLLMGKANSNYYSDHTDTTEMAYLRQIITPNNVICFELDQLTRYRTLRYLRSHPDESHRSKDAMLSAITVYQAPDYFEPGVCDEIFKVRFRYSGEPDDSLMGLRRGLYGAYGSWSMSTPDGEPALRKVTTGTYSDFTNGLEQKYTFEYYDNHLDLYAYIYNCILPPYEFDKVSQYFMRGSVPTTSTIIWDGALDNSRDPDWMYTNVFKKYWGNRDYFGYFYDHPEAWSLKTLTMPYGINMEIEYEPNIFALPVTAKDTDMDLWEAGGPRVKRLTFNKQPLIGNYTYCDYSKNYIVDLQYGIDTLHYGYATSFPAQYHKFQTRAQGIHIFHDQPYPTLIEMFLPDYINHQIIYSRVCHTFNTGGYTEYNYSISENDKITMSYSELIRISYDIGPYTFDTLDNITLYYSTWIDQSPIRGHLTSIYKYDNTDSPKYSEQFVYNINLRAYQYTRNDEDLFSERFTWPPGVNGSSTPFTTGRHIFECYNVKPILKVTTKDGVSTTEEYEYDNMGRMVNSVAHINDHDRIQNYEYLLDCDFDTTCIYCNYFSEDAYRQTICTQLYYCDTYYVSDDLWRIEVDTICNNYNYLGYYSNIKLYTEDMAAPDTSWQTLEKFTRYNYRSNFPSQNLCGLNKIWYLSAAEQWIDCNLDKSVDSMITPSEMVKTEILDIDKYGNLTRVLYPDGRTDAYIYNFNGLEAQFSNVSDSGYGILTLENTELDDITGEILNQPASWNVPAYYDLLDNTFAFTGCRSLKVPGAASSISYGPSCAFEQVDSGLYIADLWVHSPEPDKFKLFIGSQGSIIDSVCPASTNEWERLVCSVYVADQNDSLYTYTVFEYGASGNTTYVDDYRIYPAEALVQSQTFDGGLRLLSLSDNNNVPKRQYYDHFGGVMAVTDYKGHPFGGSENFFISSLRIGSGIAPDGYYDRTKPNAVYTFTDKGLGLVDDFSDNPTKKNYGISGTGSLLWDKYQERLWFSHNDTSACYSEFIVPVDSFSNGFMAFDIFRSSGTAMSVTFGFDNGSDSGYAASFSCYGDITMFEYESADYEDSITLASLPYGTFPSAWKVYVTQFKQRLMLGIVDGTIYLFWNNDCLYQLSDSTLDDFSVLKIRIQSDVATDSTMWIDNLVFHNNPTIQADYINNYGLVKQTQSYDGEKIIVTGKKNDAKGRESVSFLPVEFEPDPHYTVEYAPDSNHVAIFDYINTYINDDRIYSWNPGNGLSPYDSIYSYYADTSTGVPNCRGENQALYPYYHTIYYDDALNRVWQERRPGIYRNFHYSINQYKNTYDTAMAYRLPGLDTAYYRRGSLFEEININENANAITTFKDKLGRVVALRYDSLLLDAYTNWGYATNGDSIYMWLNLDYNGNPILTVQPEGNRIVRLFNNQSWIYYDSSGDYGVTRNVYDQMGNLRFSMNASDRAQSPSRFRYYKYDAYKRIIEEGYFAFIVWGQFFDWDHANDPDFPSDACGSLRTITAKYEYDIGEFARGQLTKSWRYPSGDPDSASWESYEYDNYGRITKVAQFIYGID